MRYLFDTNIVIYYFNGLTADDALHQAFLGHAHVFALSEAIIEQTIRLRQQFKTKTPDAIIAATALINDLTIITHNTSDFARLGLHTHSVTMKPGFDT